ncbi:MerC domain-containing protein [Rhodocytophaga rosea]|uniref:MerC domain-containing protein n=1 Tax=Rhodocytophaga rosea TaxID=2704465 RepID=A0A6C0GRA3_9BACT|nr:MerC domain-containing protein [Rhodocytophaga rosea]QHT70601.1 MerC domain-containing protein [Rhodocytophaga rosea]
MPKHKVSPATNKWNKVGVSLSFLCAIHCASTPLLIALLPMMGSELLHNPALELSLIGITVLIAGVILIRDYRHTHRNTLPLLLLLAGVLAKFLAIFVFQQTYEPVIITSGAAFILLAYVANWRLRSTHHVHNKC